MVAIHLTDCQIQPDPTRLLLGSNQTASQMTTLSSNQTALQIQPACVPPPTRLPVSSSQTASQIQSDCVPPPTRLPVSSNQTASHFQSDCLSAPTRLHPTSNQTASNSNQCACQLQPDCLSDPIRLPLSSNFSPLSAHSSERLTNSGSANTIDLPQNTRPQAAPLSPQGWSSEKNSSERQNHLLHRKPTRQREPDYRHAHSI